MGKIIELTAAEFAKRAKALDVGEHFDFAADAECCGEEPQKEEDLTEWYGVQKLSLFDNEIIIVSKYGGTGCEVFSTDNDYLTEGVLDMFHAMCWTSSVYTVDKEVQKQELSVSLAPSFCIDIRNCTYCGEDVFIPSGKTHELANEIDKYNVSADLFGKTEELSKANNFTPEEIDRMAEMVIDRRDNCDIISEAYWQIVEEVIRDFSKEKTQGHNLIDNI